jgi:hypothetical protein
MRHTVVRQGTEGSVLPSRRSQAMGDLSTAPAGHQRRPMLRVRALRVREREWHAGFATAVEQLAAMDEPSLRLAVRAARAAQRRLRPHHTLAQVARAARPEDQVLARPRSCRASLSRTPVQAGGDAEENVVTALKYIYRCGRASERVCSSTERRK